MFEQQLPCAAGKAAVAYPVPGRYSPALRVTDAEGRVTTISELLMSNRLIPKATTIMVDELAGLVGSTAVDNTVTLEFASEAQVPEVQVGAILLDRGVDGYARRVIAVSRSGSTLEVETEEAALYDAFDGGYFGMRYPQLVKLDSASPAEVTTKSLPLLTPQDVPGDVSLGSSTTNIHVPLDQNIKVSLPGGVELGFDNPSMDLEVRIVLFELSVAARYLFVNGSAGISVETDASISATQTDIDASAFIPIGPLGVGIKTPVGSLVMGAVIEAGLKAQGKVSVSWHHKYGAKVFVDERQTDPLAPDWAKQMLGYPPDVAEVWGPEPTNEASNAKLSVEVTGKLFLAPQLVMSIGNAAGVMQRAKKDKAKYDASCKQFKGARVSMGLEESLSLSGKLQTGAGGTSLCLDVACDAKLFGEFFPGFAICPSVEQPLMDTWEIFHQCWCSAAVTEVAVSPGTQIECRAKRGSTKNPRETTKPLRPPSPPCAWSRSSFGSLPKSITFLARIDSRSREPQWRSLPAAG